MAYLELVGSSRVSQKS